MRPRWMELVLWCYTALIMGLLPIGASLIAGFNGGDWGPLSASLARGVFLLSAAGLGVGALLRVATVGRELRGPEIALLLGAVSLTIGALLVYGGAGAGSAQVVAESLTFYLTAAFMGFLAVVI